MAPVRKLTRKELRLEQRPWITKGILNSMKKRDEHYKNYILTKNGETLKIYKSYRNLLITLVEEKGSSEDLPSTRDFQIFPPDLHGRQLSYVQNMVCPKYGMSVKQRKGGKVRRKGG